MTIVQLNLFITASLCTYQWKSRGGGGRAKCGQGGDLMPETIPLTGFSSCKATPRSGHLTLTGRNLVSDPVSPSRLSESHASVGERYEVFICFKLSSKQILSILRKFLSSSSHLIVKLRLKSNSTIKVRGFFTGH